jgi:hypothetical protein
VIFPGRKKGGKNFLQKLNILMQEEACSKESVNDCFLIQSRARQQADHPAPDVRSLIGAALSDPNRRLKK